MVEVGEGRVHSILFVDDDEGILRALERQLRAYSDRWEATYAAGGEEALQVLGRRSFDILVTDMMMPGIDGAALLHHVKERHPGTLRIVLSGHAEFHYALRSVPFAHQRLLKPWERQSLVAALESASRILRLVGDDVIRKSISGIGALPSAPGTYAKLSALLDSPSASFVQVSQLVASDIAMSAKVLQLANSAFVSAGRKITSVEEAVRTIGLRAIREYVLHPFLQVFEIYSPVQARGGHRFSELGRHAAHTAAIAKRLVPDPALAHMAFLTGLLHDIGQLVLLSKLPEVAREIEAEAEEKRCSIEDVELRRLGVSHAEIGGYLLGLWGLPPEICHAVTDHHERPSDAQPDALTDTLAVSSWLASEVAARAARGVHDPGVYVTELDERILAPFGGRGEIPKLITLAESCVGGAAEQGLLPSLSH